MPSKLKWKQFRTRCVCGCRATSPSTIAAHRKALKRERKLLDKKAKLHSLASARRAIKKRHSRRAPADPVPPAEPDSTYAAEDPMDVDPAENVSDLSGPSSLLARVWVGRANRRGREDEDLIPEPGSPELSEDEDAEDRGGGDVDEAELSTDDETAPDDGDKGAPTHVDISARDQLTADFQLHAARAGMFPNVTLFTENVSNPWFSPGELGSG